MTKHQKATMGLGLDEFVLRLNTGMPNMAGAECAKPGVNPELFFEETAAGIAAAKSICAGCPVADLCLSYAMNVSEFGTWGGYTEKERKQLRRDLNTSAQMVDATQVENRRLLCSSQSASSLARHFKVSERTIQRWRKEVCAADSQKTEADSAPGFEMSEVA